MSSLSFVQRTFDWDDGEMALAREEGVGTRAQLLPK